MERNRHVRVEADPLGQVEVPAEALYGAQTARARENFPVSGRTVPARIVHALALIKKHAAAVNRARGALEDELARAIEVAAAEVAEGKHAAHFPVDVFQTGSGTSTHMNVNEVIANRSIQLLGGAVGSKKPVHPNDHVNLGQSSNDVFPTAVHVAASQALAHELLPAFDHLAESLRAKGRELAQVIKLGRTHVQDALPIRLDQEFGGYAALVSKAADRVRATQAGLHELPLGGTAVGTGFGADPGFAPAVIARLAAELGLPFVQAPDLCEALSARDALVALSGAMRGAAVSLSKIANDLRWAGSGPRGGLGELRLPSLQPGSSLMPGKVNPVMSEMVLMVAADVVGKDATIAWAGAGGVFELNAMMPIMGASALEALESLAKAARLFADRCIRGITANEERCRELVERSLALGTALLPRLGYDAAADVVNEAARTGKTVRDVCLARGVLSAAELDQLLDPRLMTEPRGR